MVYHLRWNWRTRCRTAVEVDVLVVQGWQGKIVLWTHPPHAKLGPDLPVVRSAVVFGFYVLGQMPRRQNIADI